MTEKISYSIEEAAEASGLSKHTLYKKSATGELPVYKVGGRVLIPIEDFKNWLKSHRRGEVKK